MAKKWNKYKGEQPPDYTPKGFDEYMGLGRRIELSDNCNKYAYITAVVCVILSIIYKGLFQNLAGADIAMSGLATGMAFVFSFMLAKELDPEPRRKWAGILAGVFTAAAGTLLGEGNILVSFWMLFIVRLLNRTSGDRHRIIDNVILIGIAGYMGTQGYWLMPAATASLYVLESQITGGYFRSLYLAGIACAGLIFANLSSSAAISMNNIYIMAMALILFLPELRLASLTKVNGDKNGKPISTKRLVAAQGFFVMTVVVLSVFHGDKMFLAMLPSLMAALACGMYLFIYLTQHKPVKK